MVNNNENTQQATTPELEAPKRTDRQIWGIYIALCIVSVIELYSASSHEISAGNLFAPVIRHGMFLLIGLCFMVILQRLHYKNFYLVAWPVFLFSVAFMILTLFIGDYVNGARRSITIAGVALQPAEMLKFSVALIVAAILCKEQMKGVDDVTNKGVVLVAISVLTAGALLFSQGLTNTLLLMAIGISMMLIGGVSGSKLFKVLLAFAVAAMIGVGAKMLTGSSKDKSPEVENVVTVVPGTNITVGKSTVDISKASGTGRLETWVNRIKRYLKPDKYKDPITDENQQEQYSYMAQAHGGVFGVMPGNSRETARLPLAFSDYIYAIIIEEMGLLGGIIVLVLYLWLLARAGRVASRCQTAFPALLVIGMAVFITYQAIFHMAIVTGVFPVSGQPLPLISKGGTSIIMTSIALGIMLSVSRHAARKGKKSEIKEELSELPVEASAVNPS